MSDDIHRRLGRFYIDRALIERQPDVAQAIMARCIVIRCELIYERDQFEYTAISSDFAALPGHVTAPRYNVRITMTAGVPKVEFCRPTIGE